VGSYGHVLSHQAINVATSRDLGASRAYPVLKAPRRIDWMPDPILGRGWWWNEQTSGEMLPAHDYHK
jgi:hypothetical protein